MLEEKLAVLETLKLREISRVLKMLKIRTEITEIAEDSEDAEIAGDRNHEKSAGFIVKLFYMAVQRLLQIHFHGRNHSDSG